MAVRPHFAAAAYVACMVAYIYGVYDRGLFEDDDLYWIVVLAGLAALHLATGFLVSRWWAVLLPLVPFLLSIPAGFPESSSYEPLPTWFAAALTAPFEAVAIAIGVFLSPGCACVEAPPPRSPESVRGVCHASVSMTAKRQELLEHLESYYRSCGWRPERAEDGTVRAAGLLGVTWIGLPVVAEDLDDAGFEARLIALSRERTSKGRLCPLELLPDEDCADTLRATLDRLRLRDAGNVEVYSLAA